MKNRSAIFVIIFSIIGIGFLFLFSLLAKPNNVSLDELEDHEGEMVVVQGAVCDVQYTDTDETFINICGKNTIVTVVVETGDCSFDPGDIIEVRGQVVKFNKEYQIQVNKASFLEKVDTVCDDTKALISLIGYEGEYVCTTGVVTDLFQRETFYIAQLFDPASDYSITWYIYDIRMNVSLGQEVKVTGFVQLKDDGDPYLVTYNSEAVIIEGSWESMEMGIKRAFQRLSENRREFLYFPVNITGYVLYEPDPIFSTITISDRTVTGGRLLNVHLPYEFNISIIHRRDLILVSGKLVEDDTDMGLYMEAVSALLVHSSQPENITFSDLTSVHYLYEDAQVRLTAQIHTGSSDNDPMDGSNENDHNGDSLNKSTNLIHIPYQITDEYGECQIPIYIQNDSEMKNEILAMLSDILEDKGSYFILHGELTFHKPIMGYIFSLQALDEFNDVE